MNPQAAQNLKLFRRQFGESFDRGVTYQSADTLLLADVIGDEIVPYIACRDREHALASLRNEADIPDNPNPLPQLLLDLEGGAISLIHYHPVDGASFDDDVFPIETSASDLAYYLERI